MVRGGLPPAAPRGRHSPQVTARATLVIQTHPPAQSGARPHQVLMTTLARCRLTPIDGDAGLVRKLGTLLTPELPTVTSFLFMVCGPSTTSSWDQGAMVPGGTLTLFRGSRAKVGYGPSTISSWNQGATRVKARRITLTNQFPRESNSGPTGIAVR